MDPEKRYLIISQMVWGFFFVSNSVGFYSFFFTVCVCLCLLLFHHHSHRAFVRVTDSLHVSGDFAGIICSVFIRIE